MADIVIINPQFDNSFWGMENCIGLLGKRANLPVACLALLAALVPDHHEVTLNQCCSFAPRKTFFDSIGSVADIAAHHRIGPLRADCVEKVGGLARQTPTVE